MQVCRTSYICSTIFEMLKNKMPKSLWYDLEFSLGLWYSFRSCLNGRCKLLIRCVSLLGATSLSVVCGNTANGALLSKWEFWDAYLSRRGLKNVRNCGCDGYDSGRGIILEWCHALLAGRVCSGSWFIPLGSKTPLVCDPLRWDPTAE